MGRLAGKVCIITGTGGSMGRAAALLFAREGALLVGCDINVAAADETVAQVRSAGGQIVSMHPCDLTRLEDCESLRDLALATHGRIDVIFNNAAMAYFDWIDTMTVEMWKNTVDQELNLVFLMTRTVWPDLIKTRGTIVNTASASAWIAYRGLPGLAHTAAKGAVLAMTRQLAMEGAPHGIRANSISPGLIATAMSQRAQADEHILGRLPQLQPLTGAMGTAEDIAGAAAYLLSDDARFVTGAVLTVDGGWTAR